MKRFVIRSEDSGRYLKAVGETGFTHTRWYNATHFASVEEAQAFMKRLAIYWDVLIIPVQVKKNSK